MKSSEEIRTLLSGESEDARWNTWMELYRSHDGAALEEIRKIIHGKDPLFKILFVRFLGRIAEEEAVKYLVQLLEDENQVIRDASQNAFERNRFERKNQLLLPLLHSPIPHTQRFAIEKVSLGGLMEAVPLLLSLFPKAPGTLLSPLLTAFRFLPDERTIPLLLPLLKDPQEEPRFKTVLVFGALHEANVSQARKYLYEALDDKAPDVRKAALWGLRKPSSTRYYQKVKIISVNDPDPSVRREALKGMAPFETLETVTHLLKVLTLEKERNVRLRCEGILLGMPPALLTQGLEKLLMKDPAYEKAIALCASLHQNPERFFNFIRDRLQSEKEEKKKISLIEALGEVGDERAIPVLRDFLNGPITAAYTAMLSLSKIWKKQTAPDLTPYLQEAGLPILLKQTVLKFIARSGRSLCRPDDTVSLLIPYLDDQNTNIRYLAFQGLAKISPESAYEALFRALPKETDPASRKYFVEHLAASGWKYLPSLIGALVKHRDEPEILSVMIRMLASLRPSAGHFLDLFEALASPPLSLQKTDLKNNLADFLVHFLESDPSLLNPVLEKLQNIPARDALLRTLLDRLRMKKRPIRWTLPFEKWRSWFVTGQPHEKTLLVELLEYGEGCQSIPFLVSLVTKSAEPSHQRAASHSLQRFIQEGP
ncbi:MAG: HEAT repeat domain-containing protein [Deltaproteobacteria bacterium]|nr:HEAT repeat domain-containing protein [Deltaproteobacteria bacterium]MBI4374469.1 HEAT repeat domain-containing protein [Deltaproteobacteria bacterium]